MAEKGQDGGSPKFEELVKGLMPETEGLEGRLYALGVLNLAKVGQPFFIRNNLTKIGEHEVPNAYALSRGNGHMLYVVDGRVLRLAPPSDPQEAGVYDVLFNPAQGSPSRHGVRSFNELDDLYKFVGAGENPKHRWVCEDSNNSQDLDPFKRYTAEALAEA